MIKMFIPQPDGMPFDTAVGDYLKNRFYFVEGHMVRRQGGEDWPVVYFVARGLREEGNLPAPELSLYTALTSRATPGRIAITVRRETERPRLYNCPPELLSLVEASSFPKDYGVLDKINARRYRDDVRDVSKGRHSSVKPPVLSDIQPL